MDRRVLITEPVHEDALDLLRDAGWQILGPGAPMQAADALMIRIQPLSAQDVGKFTLISKHGVGVDNIPLEAARVAGVAVMNTPGANANAVAEQTLLLLLALTRDFAAQRRAADAGQSPPRVSGLEGRRLLVVGFGATGRRVAEIATALGAQVTVHSRSLTVARHAGFNIAPTLAAGLSRAEIISLHCPLTAETRHMLNADALALMPKGALVVNCARGGLIDEAALVAALESGQLAGAGLDVTETEPLAMDHPLRHAPGVVLTPHASAMSDGAFRRMGMMAAQNILDHFAGRPNPAHTFLAAD